MLSDDENLWLGALARRGFTRPARDRVKVARHFSGGIGWLDSKVL